MSGGPNQETWGPSSAPTSGGNGVLLNRTVSQGSSSSQGHSRPYQERCVDPVEPLCTPTKATPTRGSMYKADPRDANSKQAEIQDFLAVPSESYAGGTSCICTPCASVAACRTFVCNVLTCGLYHCMCRQLPCLSPAPGTAQDGRKDPHSASSDAPEKEDSESGYTDIYLRGVKVESVILDDEEEVVAYRAPLQEQPRPFDLHKCGSVYLEEFGGVDEWSDAGSGDVDALISRKLLELYSQVQIDELAKCTSDSFFLKRTSEISRLISDIVTETKLEEQDAECRLVHGIIRLSTRKSKKRPQVRRHMETPTDSGTETMKGSFSFTDSNYNDLDVQISKETSSDVLAREMRHGSDRANSSSSPTTFSPAYRETDTDSSGLPLLHRYPCT